MNLEQNGLREKLVTRERARKISMEKEIMCILKRYCLPSRMLGQNTKAGCKRRTAPLLKKKIFDCVPDI